METITEFAYDRRNHTDTTKQVIVVIPARGGSKEIYRKNLQVIGNYTLLEHTIADAYKLHCPVYVTTDCNYTGILAEQAGATVMRRPERLAQDNSKSEDAIIHLLAQMEINPETTVVFMQCTSPFRKPGELWEALQAFRTLGLDSMFSCYELYPFIWNKEGRLEYNQNIRPIRQNKEPIYVEDGSFYITRADIYFHLRNRLGGKVGRWVHDKCYGLEIDTMDDLAQARELYDWMDRSGKI